MQESMFREDTMHVNEEAGHDEPTDVQVIVSSTVSEINKLLIFFTPWLHYRNKYCTSNSKSTIKWYIWPCQCFVFFFFLFNF